MIATKTPLTRLDRRFSPSLRDELRWAIRTARQPRFRSRVQFAEQAIVLPEGPFQGEPWRRRFQPYAWHLLNEMDRSPFRRYRFSGCVQSGKTTNGPAINACWHLFERRETVIYGITSMDMARDKWMEELQPIIEASPALRRFLPRSGAGSKGGTPTALRFRNGVTLRFMSAHGRDDKRSAFTAPVVIKTEVDRYDEAGEVSREAPPVEQMEARTAAFGERAFSYEECTVTTELGRIWQQLSAGTGTTLHYQCPHCRRWVRPLREHFVAVESCSTAREAKRMGTFICPECSEIIEETQRQTMLDAGVPVQRGQTVEDGEIVGEPPDVDAFSFWWNAFDNRFWTTAHIAGEEWEAMYSKTPAEMDLKRRQFAWTTPAEPEEFDLTPLTLQDVLNRGLEGLGRGDVPEGSTWITRGVDCAKRRLHYCTRAWSRGEAVTGRGIDVGEIEVPSDKMGVREALFSALCELRDKMPSYAEKTGERHPVAWTLVDGGWMEDVVWAFMLDCRQKGIKGWLMVLGRGQSEPPGKGSYVHPEQVDGKRVLWIGEQCHMRRSRQYGVEFLMVNTDHWKTFVHDGYAAPSPHDNGALTQYDPTTTAEKKTLREFAMHHVAERNVRKIVPRRGPVDCWVNDARKPNHYLDADVYSCAAANLPGGVKVVTRERPRPVVPVASATGGETHDGRPYLAINRED